MWNASSRLRFFLPINCEKLNRANEIFKHIRIFIFFSKDGWSITRGSKRSGRKVGKMDSERTRKYEKESSKKSVRRIVPNNVTRNIYYAISWKRISICHRRINESERSREGERIYRNWRWIRSSVIDTLDILSLFARVRDIDRITLATLPLRVLFLPYLSDFRKVGILDKFWARLG